MCILGPQSFSKAMGEYFKRFQWGIATLDDLMVCVKQYFQIDKFSLDQWKHEWLQVAGQNILEVEWNRDDVGDADTTN